MTKNNAQTTERDLAKEQIEPTALSHVDKLSEQLCLLIDDYCARNPGVSWPQVTAAVNKTYAAVQHCAGSERHGKHRDSSKLWPWGKKKDYGF